ncbi:AraC family transcriptional regulator [Paenibacillus radicis (ex Xue et al. 2023)]|uniref:Helix-turn-helix domain-containing protein n=1 Tax=Paenibacillus radicis (ex Xue et al. 2023) TaxID=2972489 RepID=A0ABT1YA72_9BACL|nr:helix-turn-helix domain-containing protein [Paenibacillus radicis (ex Xue et al. 2023)]MCR8629675.1 helix-turn-helix domain-containing protein [Paenibacillus radicis (ex Xue et al. 2023)]
MKALRDSQLRLLWTARIDYPEGSRVEAHQHGDYDQLLVILSGNSGEVWIGEQRHPVKESSAYLFLRGIPHSFQFEKQAVTLDFKFHLTDERMIDAFAEQSSYYPCKGTALPEIKQWYKMSLLQMRNPDSVHPMRIEAGFKSTLISLLHEAGSALEQSGPYASVYPSTNGNEPIVHYVKENFAQKITLQLLADQFGFNPNYLVKIFNDITGMPPIQFLQEIRLEKAMEYLEFSALPITEVAEKVGWTLPYLSKMLKKRLGVTPSQYRQSLVNAVGKDIILELDFANEWRIEQQY